MSADRRMRARGESLNARFKNGEINSKQLVTGLYLYWSEDQKEKINMSWKLQYYSSFFYTLE
jgi:hypothetical protein